jgi:hypothetical protein
MYSCSNCTNIAAYSYPLNETVVAHYCEKHLPAFLYPKKIAGLLPLMTPPVVEEKTSKKKKEEQSVVEAVAEESASTDADN